DGTGAAKARRGSHTHTHTHTHTPRKVSVCRYDTHTQAYTRTHTSGGEPSAGIFSSSHTHTSMGVSQGPPGPHAYTGLTHTHTLMHTHRVDRARSALHTFQMSLTGSSRCIYEK